MKIGEIYAGKPDASDEIREQGYTEFAKNYISPSGVNIDRLASTNYGTPYYVMGDKGTGKTALLHYLENYIKKIDASACSSFISFEKNFTQIQRQQFNSISRASTSSLTIDERIATVGNDVECDFTYIWRWQLYQKLISDNEEFNCGIFVDDCNWHSFVTEVRKIGKTVDKDKMRIPAKVSFSVLANPQLGTFKPEVEIAPVDLSNSNFNASQEYGEFAKVIENATDYFGKIKRTDTQYYIFIDELEAYRGDGEGFYRDLRMIRDLLFTIKFFNDTLQSGTKIICSVRLEIMNAISRFVQARQLHKLMQGYDERLTWEHTNTNSFNHPIIGILLRRIQTAEEKISNKVLSQQEIISNWFPTNVYNMHVCTYILDNSWHKPRDIVRLLLAAQSKNSKDFTKFDQNTFETFMPLYSQQCLVEVREEMHALYSEREIEYIFNCLQGYKSVFSFQEIVSRVQKLCPDSFFAKEPTTVLNDLYRMGVIGNSLPNNRTRRWVYKGQYKLFYEEPWKIIIHPSLRLELSVNNRIEKYLKKGEELQEARKSRVYDATITEIHNRYIRVTFVKGKAEMNGYISLYNLRVDGLTEGCISEYFNVGDTIKVYLLEYNEKYKNWTLRVDLTTDESASFEIQ